MDTSVYLIRHGQSPKKEGSERNRGLTEKGIADARRIAEHLRGEGIEAFYSSPYQRASLTLEPLAQLCGQWKPQSGCLSHTGLKSGSRNILETVGISTSSCITASPPRKTVSFKSSTAVMHYIIR
ncbi:hypothetical protein DQG13_03150 [Paenibacillus sp. YN15]|nr:hypothetical protein DQG13_03150 [Paenibacillus sp. YN15]